MGKKLEIYRKMFSNDMIKSIQFGIYSGKDIDKVSRFYRSFSIINYLLFGVSNKDK